MRRRRESQVYPDGLVGASEPACRRPVVSTAPMASELIFLVLFALVILPPAAALAAASREGPESLVEEGDRLLDAGSWSEAESAYRRAIAGGEAATAARIGLARALAGGGRLDEGIEALSGSARRALRRAAYGEAEELLVAALELAPERPELLALLGRARLLDGRYEEAEAPLERLVGLGAADGESLVHYGAALWENGRLELAEDVFRRAVTAGPEAGLARCQLGRLLLWQGRYEEALPPLRACAAADPQSVEALLDLARALAGAGESAEAVGTFRHAAELAPAHSEIRYGLAQALRASDDAEGAARELAVYRRLYEEDQRRTMEEGLETVRVARGRELLRRGETEAAIVHLRSLPPSPDSLAVLAAALRQAGEPDAAVETLQRAVALAPDRTDLRMLLNEMRLELLR